MDLKGLLAMAKGLVQSIRYDGKNINISVAKNGDVVGRNIYVDGVLVTHVANEQPITITVESGELHSVTADGNIEVFGSVGGRVIADGNVRIAGSVSQSIEADGNVHVGGHVGGNVVADGNVTAEGPLNGNIKAGGNVNVGRR